MFPGTEIAHFKRLHTANLRFLLPLIAEAQAASKSWLVTEYMKGDRIMYNSQTLDLCSFAATCISIRFYGHVLLCTFVHTDIHTYVHSINPSVCHVAFVYEVICSGIARFYGNQDE
jgi:hypothetical protein